MATLSILTHGTSVPPRNALTDEDFLIRFLCPLLSIRRGDLAESINVTITLWALGYGHGR